MKELKLIFLLVCLVGITGSLHGQERKVKRPFPDGISKKIRFGMTEAKFVEEFPKAQMLNSGDSFRTVYTLKTDHSDIEQFVFYFDKDADQPLYEVIFIFREYDAPEKSAAALYGAPNYEDEEWRMNYKKWKLWSWLFKNKLIVVANIPDTEWSEEF